MSPDPEANKAVLQGFFDAVWNGHDPDRFDEFVARDVTFHRPHHDPGGHDDWLHAIRRFMAAFPDTEIRVDSLVAEGDVVAGRIVMSGTHQGAFFEHAPTGRRYTVQGRPWCRVQDGRIVAFWSMFDELGLLIDIGALPGSARAFGGAAEPAPGAPE